MPEVKEFPVPFPPLGYVKMKMLCVTEEDIANCDTKCENCMKVRFEHPDMAGERNDWCADCNDEERKRNGMTEYAMGLWTLDQVNKGRIIGVMRQDRGSIHVKD
tara:strand:+ start:1948 stop:2259 length:312 start_codon:yes stop_codon:yes gene_type:complete